MLLYSIVSKAAATVVDVDVAAAMQCNYIQSVVLKTQDNTEQLCRSEECKIPLSFEITKRADIARRQHFLEMAARSPCVWSPSNAFAKRGFCRSLPVYAYVRKYG